MHIAVDRLFLLLLVRLVVLGQSHLLVCAGTCFLRILLSFISKREVEIGCSINFIESSEITKN